MARQNTQGQASEPKPEAPKKERKVLTQAERIAKLEADLAAARAKAAAKVDKARTDALERRAKLVTKRDEINAKIAEIDAEFPPAETDTQVTEPEGDES